jgi:hypothetical protein
MAAGGWLSATKKCSPVGSIRQLAQPPDKSATRNVAIAARQANRNVARGDTSMPPAGGFLRASERENSPRFEANLVEVG